MTSKNDLGRQTSRFEIDVGSARAALDRGALFVDVRRIDQYEAGHIPGAVAIPLLGEAGALFRLPRDRDVIIY